MVSCVRSVLCDTQMFQISNWWSCVLVRMLPQETAAYVGSRQQGLGRESICSGKACRFSILLVKTQLWMKSFMIWLEDIAKSCISSHFNLMERSRIMPICALYICSSKLWWFNKTTKLSGTLKCIKLVFDQFKLRSQTLVLTAVLWSGTMRCWPRLTLRRCMATRSLNIQSHWEMVQPFSKQWSVMWKHGLCAELNIRWRIEP